jgi:hypothetical protein
MKLTGRLLLPVKNRVAVAITHVMSRPSQMRSSMAVPPINMGCVDEVTIRLGRPDVSGIRRIHEFGSLYPVYPGALVRELEHPV